MRTASRHMSTSGPSLIAPGNILGYTLIELLIAVSTIAVILTVALPIYSDYMIRIRIAEALSEGAAAQSVVRRICSENPEATAINAAEIGYDFVASTYVSDISVSGSCSKPIIKIQTQLTGATPDPLITLTGYLAEDHMEFACVAPGSLVHIPRDCRS